MQPEEIVRKHIFISYKQREADELAEKLYDDLSSDGHTVYYDKKNVETKPFAGVAADFIADKADVFLALFSKPDGDRKAKSHLKFERHLAYHWYASTESKLDDIVPICATPNATADNLTFDSVCATFPIIKWEDYRQMLKMVRSRIQKGFVQNTDQSAKEILEKIKNTLSSEWDPHQESIFSEAPLPLNSASYVRRSCDDDVQQFFDLIPPTPYKLRGNGERSAILITGPKECGKTSLMNQTAAMLGKEWIVISAQISQMGPENPTKFMKRFYMEHQLAYGKSVNDFDDIKNLAIKERPCLLQLDELGGLSFLALEQLLTQFCNAFETSEMKQRYRVVATHTAASKNASGLKSLVTHCLERFNEFAAKPIDERTLALIQNDKFTSFIWDILTVPPFAKENVAEENAMQLFSYLPTNLQSLVLQHRSEIFINATTKYWDDFVIGPRPLQIMLKILDQRTRAGASVEQQVQIILNPASYTFEGLSWQ